MKCKKKPKISVIIPTYNRQVLLGYSLRSLVNQTLDKQEFEVLVVDDGSSDDSQSMVESFERLLNVQYFYQEDKGFRVAEARNIGIESAIGDICVFVDSGVLLSQSCLKAYLDTHTSHRGPLAVVGYVYGFNDNNQDAELIKSIADVNNVSNTIDIMVAKGIFSDPREKQLYSLYENDLDNIPAPWISYWTCNVSCNRELLVDVGAFDTHFTSWGGEDVELAYRLFMAGAKFILKRDAAAFHYPHLKDAYVNTESNRSNLVYLHKKHSTMDTKLFYHNEMTLNHALFQMREMITSTNSLDPDSSELLDFSLDVG